MPQGLPDQIKIISMAKEQYEDATLDIEDTAKVELAKDDDNNAIGAWVQAWVYIEFDKEKSG